MKWLLLLLTLSTAPAQATPTCQSLFEKSTAIIDGRYGNADQNDYWFTQKNLAALTESHLCGPICLYNVLVKLRGQTPRDEHGEVFRLIVEIFPNAGLKAEQLIHQGAWPTHLVHALDIIANEENMRLRLQIFGSEQIELEHLRSSTDDNRSTIVMLRGYKNADRTGPSKAHFMVVNGWDLENWNQFYFLDPARNLKARTGWVEQITNLPGRQQGYKLKLQDASKNYGLVVIESVIKIEKQKPLADFRAQ